MTIIGESEYAKERRCEGWLRQYEEFKETASNDELRYFEEFKKFKETGDSTFLASPEATELKKRIRAEKVRAIEDLVKRKEWI